MEKQRDDRQVRFQAPSDPPSERELRRLPTLIGGTDASIRRELLRRLSQRDVPADQAPQFHAEHPDVMFICQQQPACADVATRILDVCAVLIDGERDRIRDMERRLREREDALDETAASRARGDGLPADTTAALEDAIRACGRTNHVAARKRLGDRLYEAINGLGYGCCWAWLCQQPVVALPDIARRLDRLLGRKDIPDKPWQSGAGGGTHFRKQTPARRTAVAPEQLADLLAPMTHGLGVYVPLEQLKEYRLTAGDWSALAGQTIRKMQQGFVNRNAFGNYLLAVVRRWEADHPIKQREGTL